MFDPGADARDAVTGMLSKLSVPRDPPLIALHVGASHEVNRWDPERFGKLARELTRRGMSVVVTGTSHERSLVERVLACAGSSNLYDLCGRLDLRTLAALYERCTAVVVGDTGPLHLAAAVGTRTIALFGAADPVRTGPRGAGHRVLRVPLDCVPCRARQCLRTDRPRACMEDLTVEAVAAAVLGAVDEALPGEPGRAGGAAKRTAAAEGTR
jgi:ADP-heptose:LPS heptosyltransferase